VDDEWKATVGWDEAEEQGGLQKRANTWWLLKSPPHQPENQITNLKISMLAGKPETFNIGRGLFLSTMVFFMPSLLT
jgi:hypothetical protein